MKLHWGNAIFIFFVGFLGLAAVFITFAMRQDNDLVTRDYYEQGANYSEQIETDRRSAAYDTQISIEQSKTDLLLIIPDTLLKIADNFKVHFYRPSDQDLDYLVNLDLASDSVYIAKDKLAQGRYQVKMNWLINEETYFINKEIWVSE